MYFLNLREYVKMYEERRFLKIYIFNENIYVYVDVVSNCEY